VQLQPLVDALKGHILSHSVLHADETPVEMLKPGNKKTHRAYLWAYAPGAFEDLKAVVYDFCESRAGEHARTFLGKWKGSLVCDDYAGYKAGFVSGITEAGCMAHSRRKFFDLHVSSKSQIAGQACAYISQLYDVERDARHLSADERLQIRQRQSKPLADAFKEWMLLQRQKITDGSATAKALDYSLKRWGPLTQFLDDGQLPIDNNWIENQIRPIAIGRNHVNCPFMRIRPRTTARTRSVNPISVDADDSHNHSPCKNRRSASDGRNRTDFSSGGSSRASARSFIPRSASTYMCVVDGLS